MTVDSADQSRNCYIVAPAVSVLNTHLQGIIILIAQISRPKQFINYNSNHIRTHVISISDSASLYHVLTWHKTQ